MSINSFKKLDVEQKVQVEKIQEKLAQNEIRLQELEGKKNQVEQALPSEMPEKIKIQKLAKLKNEIAIVRKGISKSQEELKIWKEDAIGSRECKRNIKEAPLKKRHEKSEALRSERDTLQAEQREESEKMLKSAHDQIQERYHLAMEARDLYDNEYQGLVGLSAGEKKAFNPKKLVAGISRKPQKGSLLYNRYKKHLLLKKKKAEKEIRIICKNAGVHLKSSPHQKRLKQLSVASSRLRTR